MSLSPCYVRAHELAKYGGGGCGGGANSCEKRRGQKRPRFATDTCAGFVGNICEPRTVERHHDRVYTGWSSGAGRPRTWTADASKGDVRAESAFFRFGRRPNTGVDRVFGLFVLFVCFFFRCFRIAHFPFEIRLFSPNTYFDIVVNTRVSTCVCVCGFAKTERDRGRETRAPSLTYNEHSGVVQRVPYETPCEMIRPIPGSSKTRLREEPDRAGHSPKEFAKKNSSLRRSRRHLAFRTRSAATVAY